MRGLVLKRLPFLVSDKMMCGLHAILQIWPAFFLLAANFFLQNAMHKIFFVRAICFGNCWHCAKCNCIFFLCDVASCQNHCAAVCKLFCLQMGIANLLACKFAFLPQRFCKLQCFFFLHCSCNVCCG